MNKVEPVTLTGRYVRLEPLREEHSAGLAEVGLEQEIWQYMVYGEIQSEADIRRWIIDLLERQSKGTDLPFVVVELASGKIVGATRYLNIDIANSSLEIGGTWYGKAYQRTAVNSECKYLLMRHAFEALQVVRVQFKTDLRNVRSQRAIERLGAVKEGVLRNHMTLPDGFIRHSVFYSVVPDEWPAIKANLEQKLA